MQDKSSPVAGGATEADLPPQIGVQPLLSGFLDAAIDSDSLESELHGFLRTSDGSVVLRPEDQQAMLDRLEMAAMVLPPVKEERVLRKAVQAVHSYPMNGEHTLVTRRVINALIEHAQQIMRKFKPEELAAMRRFRISPRYTVTVKRLLDLTEMGESNHSRIYEAIERIYSWSIKWNLMGDGDHDGADINDARVLNRRLDLKPMSAAAHQQDAADDGSEDFQLEVQSGSSDTDMGSMHIIERVNSRLISQWSRGEGPRQGLVSFEFPPDVLWMLLEPKIYAQIQMRVFNELGSAAAAAIYENCVRYFGSTTKVTPQLPIQEWMNLIVGQGLYKGRLSDFKRYVVDPSLKNIAAASSCPFTVDALWIKGPKNKVVALQFKLHAKRQFKLDMDMPLAWHPRTLDVLKKVFGMNDAAISEIARSADEAEVRQAIDVYSGVAERKLKKGEPITDRQQYFKGILRNLQEGRRKDEDLEKTDEPVESMSANAKQATEQMAELKERFERHRQARIIEELMRLPTEQYTRLQTSFIELHSTHVAVQRFVGKGWNPPHPAVAGMFAHWFMVNHPQTVEEMLTREEDKDFAYWLVLQSMPGAKS